MKINSQNITILYHILKAWLVSIYRIMYLNPISYINTSETDVINHNKISKEDWRRIHKTIKGIRILSPFIMKSRRCLMEALILNSALNEMGINTRIHFGIRKDRDSVLTHAWVSVCEKIIIGGPVNEYEEFVKIH